MGNIKLSMQLLLLLLCMGGLLSAASQAAVTVTLTPLKERYALDEPIAITYAIHNDTNEEVHVYLNYPDAMGLDFNCEDEQCISNSPAWSWNILLSLFTVKPLETYQRTIVLNRYL